MVYSSIKIFSNTKQLKVSEVNVSERTQMFSDVLHMNMSSNIQSSTSDALDPLNEPSNVKNIIYNLFNLMSGDILSIMLQKRGFIYLDTLL